MFLFSWNPGIPLRHQSTFGVLAITNMHGKIPLKTDIPVSTCTFKKQHYTSIYLSYFRALFVGLLWEEVEDILFNLKKNLRLI